MENPLLVKTIPNKEDRLPQMEEDGLFDYCAYTIWPPRCPT